MVLYIESSAMVKLYLREVLTDEVRHLVTSATTLVASTGTYAEVRAALASRQRQGDLSPEEALEVVEALDRDWLRYSTIDVTPSIVMAAGELAQTYALRGYDSIQLATACVAMRHFIDEDEPDSFLMVVFDSDLVEAAPDLGIPIWEP